MRILLISGTGTARALELRHPLWIAGIALALLCLLVAWGFRGEPAAGDRPSVKRAILERWTVGLEAEGRALRELRQEFVAESAAQGKLLARMQARLLRMEALGGRMVAAAALDPAEFDFGSVPAVGGPLTASGSGLAAASVAGEIEAFAARLRAREAELQILENVMVSRELVSDQQPSGLPVERGWVSSPFGTRVDPIHGRQAFHAGVDFVGKPGASVLAAGAGVVTFAGEKSQYGKTIEISHGNGLLTRYGHHSSLEAEVGDIVQRGDVIGLMGRTGRATGYHVHFEVEQDGKQIDPVGFLKKNRA